MRFHVRALALTSAVLAAGLAAQRAEAATYVFDLNLSETYDVSAKRWEAADPITVSVAFTFDPVAPLRSECHDGTCDNYASYSFQEEYAPPYRYFLIFKDHFRFYPVGGEGETSFFQLSELKPEGGVSLSYHSNYFTTDPIDRHEAAKMFRIAGPIAASYGVGSTSYRGTARFNETLSVVPEPATWALLIAGFGLTGALFRCRRPGQAAVR